MAVIYVEGDMLSSPARGVVIPVNCMGVAGRGLALQCRQCYPRWFELYQWACKTGKLGIGRLVVHLDASFGDRYILDFPTKYDWREPSELAYIEAGLQWLVKRSGPCWVPRLPVAFPKLGCGAGGLSWCEVQPLMEHYLSQLPCECWVFV